MTIHIQEYAYSQPGNRRTHQEMRQKPAPRDTFFSLRSEPHNARPTSVATEFVDTDWDEEIISEVEDNSPRVSLQSVSGPSPLTTFPHARPSLPVVGR